MNNILFIGGAGFIGSSLINKLLKETDYSIFVLEPAFANVSRIQGLNVTIFREKLDNTKRIEEIVIIHKISCIVHLVSGLIPGSGYDEFIEEVQNVVFPTMRLSQLCSKIGIKLVFYSSGGTVYGNRHNLMPFVEDDERKPISYYGLTKLMIENNILFEHRTQGLEYLILRPSNPYGHGQSINGKQGFIAVALGKALRGETIDIWGDGSSIRDYILINDLCEIFVGILKANIINTTLNIGSGIGYSLNQIIDIIKKTTKYNLKINYTAARSQDVSTMVLSTNKLKSLISFKITPLEVGIKSFFDDIKKSQSIL